MSREIALFAGVPTEARAGEAIQTAATLEVGRLYALELVPQTTVRFAEHSGKGKPAENSNAGLARLRAGKHLTVASYTLTRAWAAVRFSPVGHAVKGTPMKGLRRGALVQLEEFYGQDKTCTASEATGP